MQQADQTSPFLHGQISHPCLFRLVTSVHSIFVYLHLLTLLSSRQVLLCLGSSFFSCYVLVCHFYLVTCCTPFQSCYFLFVLLRRFILFCCFCLVTSFLSCRLFVISFSSCYVVYILLRHFRLVNSYVLFVLCCFIYIFYVVFVLNRLLRLFSLVTSFLSNVVFLSCYIVFVLLICFSLVTSYVVFISCLLRCFTLVILVLLCLL